VELTRAIVRPPATTFAAGLTSADLGTPDLAKAIEQHERYCTALEACGLILIRLPPDADFPDSTFVEDTAVVGKDWAILACPGAASRSGEVARIEPLLRETFAHVEAISSPGTVDGGDVCHANGHFFIGVSERTNAEGASQLARLLGSLGHSATAVDLHNVPGMLHLKSGLSYLGDNRLALIDTLADREEFRGFELVRVHPHERYAANCVRINDRILMAAGHPRLESTLTSLGYSVIALEMSEFRKMDGALTCLSLRF